MADTKNVLGVLASSDLNCFFFCFKFLEEIRCDNETRTHSHISFYFGAFLSFTFLGLQFVSSWLMTRIPMDLWKEHCTRKFWRKAQSSKYHWNRSVLEIFKMWRRLAAFGQEKQGIWCCKAHRRTNVCVSVKFSVSRDNIRILTKLYAPKTFEDVKLTLPEEYNACKRFG